MLVDVLVSLLAQPSQLLRTVAHQVFERLCPQITPAALDILVQVLAAADGDGLLGHEDDDDDNDDDGGDDDDDAAQNAQGDEESDTPHRARRNPVASADSRAAEMATMVLALVTRRSWDAAAYPRARAPASN